MTNKQQIVTFYGNMKWFDVDDDTDDLVLPPPFVKARKLWEESPEKNFTEIIRLIEPYVKAWFVPAALSDSQDLFPNQSDFEATKINVVGIDFSAELFPLCKAEAWFEVTVSNNFNEINIEERQSETGEYFHQAISFGWEIPSEEGCKPTIYTYGNHQGVECMPNAHL